MIFYLAAIIGTILGCLLAPKTLGFPLESQDSQAWEP